MASASLAPFRSRDFSLMWGGALVSNIGTWMETVALGYYVADTTGKASWSAVVAAAGFLPNAVLGPVGSAMADRLRRKRVLLTTNALSAAIAAILALWVGTGNATPLGIALLGMLAGSVGGFGFPSFQTSLPDLVPREHLTAAVGLSNAQWNLGRIIGPTCAGLAIAAGGIETALWCNAVSFGAVMVALLLTRFPDRRGGRRPVFAALADGVRFARSSHDMRRMLLVMFVVIGFGSPFIALVPQVATNVFGGDESATSLLVTAQGVGAVVAAFTLGSVTLKLGARRVLLVASAAMAASLALYGGAPRLWLAAPALTLVGMTYGYAFTSMSGIAQHAAPDEMRGRVLAVNSFVLGTLYPLGALAQGAIADATSVRAVTVGSGAALALGLLLVTGRQRRADALRPPVAGALPDRAG